MPTNDVDERRNVIDDGDDENETSAVITEHPRRLARITVELPLFLIMMGINLSGTAVNNILLYRTCVHTLNHSKEECKGFLLPEKTNATVDLEGEVQKYVAYILMLRMILESLVPAALALFIGVWSDTHGRKPLIVWPLFGVALSSMLIVVYSMLDDYGPWWLILASLPYSLSGGYSMLITGAYCYVIDITTKGNRSLRLMLFDAAIALGSMLGLVLSSHLLRAVGNVYLLLVTTALYVFSYAFTDVFIRESLPGAIRGGLGTLFKFSLVKEMLYECFKSRPNNARALILMLALANTFGMFTGNGSYNLEYLYVRQKLHWAMNDYTLYSGINTMIALVGGFVGVIVFQKLLGVSDVVMVIVALVSAMAEYVIKSLAVMSWHMYFGASISLVKGLSSPLIKSFLSKVIAIEDTAKIFALLCMLDAFCPILAPLVYNSLYSTTLNTFPGAFYILSAGLTGLCVLLLGSVQYLLQKNREDYRINGETHLHKHQC